MVNRKDKRLIIGLGNPILGDDGVGWEIVSVVDDILENLASQSKNYNPDIEYLSVGGLYLMEKMVGYEEVIIVDTILTGSCPIGTVFSLPFNRLPNYSSGHTTSSHDTSLATALNVGKQMGLELPEKIWVVAVEAANVYDFSEILSPPIKAAVPYAAEEVLNLLEI